MSISLFVLLTNCIWIYRSGDISLPHDYNCLRCIPRQQTIPDKNKLLLKDKSTQGPAILCYCQRPGNSMRAGVSAFLSPGLPATRGSHKCLHTDFLHTGMPVIPECTVCRAPVRKGRRQPTTIGLPGGTAQKPTPPLPDFELGWKPLDTEDREPAPKYSRDPRHLITTRHPTSSAGLK